MLPISYIARKAVTHKRLHLQFKSVAREFLALGDVKQHNECIAKAREQRKEQLYYEGCIIDYANECLMLALVRADVEHRRQHQPF